MTILWYDKASTELWRNNGVGYDIVGKTMAQASLRAADIGIANWTIKVTLRERLILGECMAAKRPLDNGSLQRTKQMIENGLAIKLNELSKSCSRKNNNRVIIHACLLH